MRFGWLKLARWRESLAFDAALQAFWINHWCLVELVDTHDWKREAIIFYVFVRHKARYLSSK